jgi:uncharacterized protein YhjY with autotransporter beta-barrel domain
MGICCKLAWKLLSNAVRFLVENGHKVSSGVSSKRFWKFTVVGFCALVFLAMGASSMHASEFNKYKDKLSALYGPLAQAPGLTPDRAACSQCHTPAGTGVNTGSWNFFGTKIKAESGGASAISIRIRTVAENGFVPKVKGQTTFKISGVTPPPQIALAYSPGKINLGNSDTDAKIISYKILPLSGPSVPFSLSSAGALIPGVVVQGETYRFQVEPKNSAGFRPLDPINLPPITVVVNTPPNVIAALVETRSPDDNADIFSSPPLIDPNGDDDTGDKVVGVTTSTPKIVSLKDESGGDLALDTYILGQGLSATGVLSFDPKGFDELVVGESRKVVFEYAYTDGTDTGTSTYEVTVTGVAEPGANTPPDLTALRRTFSEDDKTPIAVELLEDNRGNPFKDPDKDVLAATTITPDLAGSAAFSRTSSQFNVDDLSSFNNLSVGEFREFTFDYGISETRDGSVVNLNTNSLSIRIEGRNDPISAKSAVVATVKEAAGLRKIDIFALSEADDPDSNDSLTLQNLSTVSSSPTLKNPASAKLSADGVSFEFVPVFVEDLADGATVDVTFSFEVSDGQGSVKKVDATITVEGVEINDLAGRYANSLPVRYPLAGFQNVSGTEAECFTCHANQATFNKPGKICNNADHFNPYGRQLCELTGTIGIRLALTESGYAPSIMSDKLGEDIVRYLSETSASGTDIGAPIRTNPGTKVDGSVSSIFRFDIENDAGGIFGIEPSGQIKLRKKVSAGEYTLDVFPINISGSKNKDGVERNVAGFYPVNSGRTPIRIRVRGAPPIAVDDVISTRVNKAVTISVLDNDRGGPAFSVQLGSTAPSNGTVSMSKDGKNFVYEPDAGFSGGDKFTYNASNGAPADDSTATVRITVVGKGGAVAVNDVAVTTVGKSIKVSVLSNDVGSGRFISQIVTAPSNGSATITANSKRIKYTPKAGFEGDDFIVYEARNAKGSSTATLKITVTRISGDLLAGATEDPELKKVAQAFGNSCIAAPTTGTPGSDLDSFLSVCSAISSAATSGEDIDAALLALRNEENLAVVDTASVVARGVGAGIQSRIDRIRSGARRGIDVSALSFSLGGMKLPQEAVTKLTHDLLGLNAGTAFKSSQGFDPHTPWGLFLSGNFVLAERNVKGRSGDFDLTANNLVAGVDFQVDPRSFLGVAIGFSTSDTDFSNGGNLSATGYQLSVYGGVNDFPAHGLSLDGYASIGKVNYRSDRRITFTSSGVTVDTRADASFTGTQINIAPRLSYSILSDEQRPTKEHPTPGIEITISGSLDYLRTKIRGYTETGGAGLALNTQSQTYESLQASLGADFRSSTYAINHIKFDFFGNLSANAELLDVTRTLTSSFVAAGPGAPTFTVTEDGNKGLFGTVEIGAKFNFGKGDLLLSYARDFNRADNLNSQRILVGFSGSVFGNDTLGAGIEQSFASRNDNRWNARLDYSLDF